MAGRKTGRTYERNGKPYWSVTTILGAINKPALINWASYGARDATRAEAVKAYLATHPVSSAGRHCLGLDGVSFENIITASMGRRPAHLMGEQAAEIGTLVHARIEAEIRRELGQAVQIPIIPESTIKGGVKVGHPAYNAYLSYLAWRKAHEMRVVSIEQRVYSDKYEYAGTADLLAYIDDVLTLADFKTSKGVYGEYRLQIAAYRQAVLEMEHGNPDVKAPLGGMILRFPKEEGDDFEAAPVAWEDQDALMAAFLHAKGVWEWQLADEERMRKPDRAIVIERGRGRPA